MAEQISSFQTWAAGETCMSAEQAQELMPQLSSAWQLVTPSDGAQQLRALYKTPDFVSALELATRVGDLAERHDHHPELSISWGKLQIIWYTHSLGGLHRNDFFMAAQCDLLHSS